MDSKHLEVLIPIIVALIGVVGAFFGSPLSILIEILRKKRLEKITNSVEPFKLFENYDTEFKNNFILPDLKENYFYIQTDIKTNEKSILKYIEFKNRLGRNYTWKQIKSVSKSFRY